MKNKFQKVKSIIKRIFILFTIICFIDFEYLHFLYSIYSR